MSRSIYRRHGLRRCAGQTPPVFRRLPGICWQQAHWYGWEYQDQGVGAIDGDAHRLGHPAGVVSDDALEVMGQAVIGEPTGDRRCVGVDDLAEQHLGSDGEDLDLHEITVAERSVP